MHYYNMMCATLWFFFVVEGGSTTKKNHRQFTRELPATQDSRELYKKTFLKTEMDLTRKMLQIDTKVNIELEFQSS